MAIVDIDASGKIRLSIVRGRAERGARGAERLEGGSGEEGDQQGGFNSLADKLKGLTLK